MNLIVFDLIRLNISAKIGIFGEKKVKKSKKIHIWMLNSLFGQEV